MRDASDATSSARDRERLAWARGALACPTLVLERASFDAGFRSYWRVRGADAQAIVMDAPPATDDVRPWLAMGRVLAGAGLHVPAVLAEDVARGFLLIEDLGTRGYIDVLDAGNADALFADAIAALVVLQRIPPPPALGRYDRAFFERELGIFEEWFLHRHLGVTLDAREREAWKAIGDILIASNLAQPQVLTHRDWMPRNLMHCAPNPGVLDFQDAVVGPIAYDPASLFRDAFVSWPQARVEGWLRRYHEAAAAAGLPVPPWPRFARDADLAGAQRHLKILGIFARLHHRDGKPKYLVDAPRFLRYLLDAIARHPELAPLGALLDTRVLPRIAAADAAA
ncbi:aminoglycoside phosphotransferase family protein [Coralloluteibacterium stylophorae]|uniref:aminoglycoside phosphotransferase family protein n=1 Tax=Coralloluteibacterium stylophorae TaxID=1776034 RepID=UPI0030843759